MLADVGRVVGQGRAEVGLVERAEAVQGIEGVEPPARVLAVAEEPLQRGDGGRVLTLEEQPVGRVAMPAVGMLEQADQLRRARPGSSRGVGRWRKPGGARR